ncbi:Nif3-like dinuclear metal center hexameric protein [Legionella geestiana]|uniref:Nif3-like dinuclear metal center hexameric protein n=1 Tax=Legionella geestiana TaxID=45065 RepID=UPI00109211CC|nr:Nif3-like dinuclear metal center hexameric protein [Legionella geestiana]QDQ38930.1 Nif3-like dinuclear metal center hexameric protein [Legionella geestiana]
MIQRDALSCYLDELLACSSFSDYAPNGLQVEGRENISRICTAVTANREVIARATEAGADALIVHHGYFWRGEDLRLTGLKGARIRALFSAGLSLFAYHLPLDCHLELGNNAQLAKRLQLRDITCHRAGNTDNLLWMGTLTRPMTEKALSSELARVLEREPLFAGLSDAAFSRVALCTGAAQDFLSLAHALGADAYISGEISERTWYEAHELGIGYFAAGHHATERFGIEALGEHLAAQFALEHQFIDSNNPV